MDEAKIELVRAWLLRAAHDLAAARRLGVGDAPLLDVAAYHCQQTAEKALKGFLVFFDVRVPKTHDVGLLLDEAARIEPGFSTWRDMGDRLTPLATAYRYPGDPDQPEEGDVAEAIEDSETILRQALNFLPVACHPDLGPVVEE